jgi:hypothetical protein
VVVAVGLGEDGDVAAQAAMVVLLVVQSVAPGIVLGWTRCRYRRRQGGLWKPA